MRRWVPYAWVIGWWVLMLGGAGALGAIGDGWALALATILAILSSVVALVGLLVVWVCAAAKEES